MKTYSSQQGFTLIELLLYVALISIFMTSAVYFAWDAILSSNKSHVQRLVNDNGRFIAQRIMYEIRNSSGINALTTTDVCLSSANPTYNPTRIYLQGADLRIAWGGGTSNCTNMTNDESLNSSEVVMSNVIFSNLSQLQTQHISFSFTVTTSADRQEWQQSQTYRGSSEIRTP